MTFGEQLNDYIALLGCTAKELAAAAGVSASQLSRWRSGERKPTAEQAAQIAAGLDALARERGGVPDTGDIRSVLSAALAEDEPDYQRIVENFNALLNALDLRISELSKAMSFDASYLSRIRSGQRRPADVEAFVDGVCRFAARKSGSDRERAVIAALTGVEEAALNDPELAQRALAEWMYGGTLDTRDTVGEFLQRLDEFDLNEYIRAIHFDELKIPTAPFRFPSARYCTGLKEMMEGELSFLRATALSRSAEPVVIFSEMPMAEMAKDPEFPKKWMFGMACLLKRGLHLNMIHNMDRPFHELMLGLESFIPMYMTGQISPFYLRDASSGPFRHLLEVSGAAALSGEAIAGHHAEGRYYLVTKKEELRYYRQRADALLQKASPLMDIYREDRETQFREFLQSEAEKGRVPQMLDTPAFRNITIRACQGRWVIVSKAKAPAIHFVIRHPRLMDAIERFSPPVVE